MSPSGVSNEILGRETCRLSESPVTRKKVGIEEAGEGCTRLKRARWLTTAEAIEWLFLRLIDAARKRLELPKRPGFNEE